MPRWDDRLLRYMNTELQHLWGMGAEFDLQNPGIAPFLRLGSRDAQDPFVERLLDGFAFMAARVRLKLDEEFPRFTQGLLESIHPNYLSPLPAMTIAQITPKTDEGVLTDGYAVPRNSVLTSARSDGTPCTFLTKHALTLWPIGVREARYFTAVDLGNLKLAGMMPPDTRAAIRIQLETRMPQLAFSKMPLLDSLTFHLAGMPRTPISLYEQLFAHAGHAIARPDAAFSVAPPTPAFVGVNPPPPEPVRLSPPLPVGFREDQALLPTDPRAFSGYRLLTEYFTLPQRFLFFELTGLKNAVRNCNSSVLEIVIPLRREERALETLLKAQHLALFCTPAINLFPETIRTSLTQSASEFPLIPQLNPQDYEVFSVEKLVATGAYQARGGPAGGKGVEHVFYPFYRMVDAGRDAHRYFTINRLDNRFERAVAPNRDRADFLSANDDVMGLAETAQRRARQAGVAYRGSDVYVTLVDANEAPYSSALTSFVASVLCTNRALAATIRPGEQNTDFSLSVGAPVQSVRCVSGVVTAARPSYADGDFTWRLIDHLAGNQLAFSGEDPVKNANALRELLSLYSTHHEPREDPQVQAVRELSTRIISDRLPTPGPLAFARGVELNVQLDETAFEGIGVFALGCVLEEFFRRYVTINSFTRTVLSTPQRGTVMTWPARLGSKHLL